MQSNFINTKISLEQSIIYTLLFFGIQKRPLTFEELKRCIPLNKINGSDLNEEISKLQLKKIIIAKTIEKSNIPLVYYCHKIDEEILNIFESRKEIREELEKKAIYLAKYIKFIPFVRQIYIANSLSLGTCNENSDIDFFIVTKKNRLFLCRILITGLLMLLNERRFGKNIKKKVCLSFFIDEKAINLKPLAIENDIYLPYWILFLKPLIPFLNPSEFCLTNSWIRDFLLNTKKNFHSPPPIKLLDIVSSVFKSFFEIILEVTLLSRILNFVCKVHQLSRARKKMKKLDQNSSNIANNHVLKFHNLDRRKYYRDLFLQRINEI